jgi:hypothetical protein
MPPKMKTKNQNKILRFIYLTGGTTLMATGFSSESIVVNIISWLLATMLFASREFTMTDEPNIPREPDAQN